MLSSVNAVRHAWFASVGYRPRNIILTTGSRIHIDLIDLFVSRGVAQGLRMASGT